MRVTIDLMKKSTQIIDLSNVINPRVGDDDLLLPLHIVYDDNQTDMRGKDVEFLSNDPNKKNIYIAGTCNTNTPGDNLLMGNLTFRFPAGTFKADGTYDPDKTMFRIVDKETQKVISSVNVKITVMKNNIEFDFDPDKSSYDSRAETMLQDFHDKGQAMLDEIKDLKNQANSNVSGDTATTAKEAKKQADQNAGDISDLRGEVTGARGRFADMAGREDAQDAAINQKESIVNANANYAALQQKNTQQDSVLSQKAGKYELEEKLAQMNLQPEMYADLNAVNAAYPNGTTKFIATDDGYLALYRNGQWIKGPIFQAAGIADDSISDSKLQEISTDKIQVNDVLFGKEKNFSDNPVKTTGNSFQINNTVSEHAGVYIPINVKGKKRTFFSFTISDIVNGGFTEGPQLYSVKVTGNELQPDQIIQNYEAKNGIEDCKLIENQNDNEIIWLLFVINGKGSLKLTVQASDYLTSNYNFGDLTKRLTFADNLESSRLTHVEVWGGKLDSNLMLVNDDLIRFEQMEPSGNYGAQLYVSADLNEKLHLNLFYRAQGTCDVYIEGDSGLMKVDDLIADGAYHTLSYDVLPGVLESNKLTSVRDVLIATHAQYSKFEIYGFNFSTLKGKSNIAATIDGLIEQVGSNNPTQIGSLKLLSKIKDSQNIKYVSCKQSVNDDNQVIRTIEIQAKKNSNITLVVGSIDQNGLLVNSTEYPSWVHEGYNQISVNYPINSGQQLFLKWDPDVFDLYENTEFSEKIMIQDNSHQSTKVGYEGYSFYEVDGQVPLSYTYSPLTLLEKFNRSQQKLEEAEKKLSTYENPSQKKLTIKDNNGKSYRLTVEDGKLGIQSAAPSKVAIFGNSLTSNTGGIGMAASDQYHDWYYLTSQYLKEQNPSVTINDRLNVSTWEQAESSADRQAVFDSTIKPQLSADTDLVIIQLGDNVNTDARKATIEEDSRTLINNIKQISPNAEIYWLASWFGNPDLIGKFHNACLAAGATHIDINDLNTKENQSSIGTPRTGLDGKSWRVAIPGEAVHPGDAGMKAIADRLIANFDF